MTATAKQVKRNAALDAICATIDATDRNKALPGIWIDCKATMPAEFSFSDLYAAFDDEARDLLKTLNMVIGDDVHVLWADVDIDSVRVKDGEVEFQIRGEWTNKL